MTEKRAGHRSLIELAASFGMPEDSVADQPVQINNISQGGFCFSSHQQLNVGQQLNLVIEVEPGNNIEILVKVAWTKENLFGVQICKTTGPDFERFIEFYRSVVSRNN